MPHPESIVFHTVYEEKPTSEYENIRDEQLALALKKSDEIATSNLPQELQKHPFDPPISTIYMIGTSVLNMSEIEINGIFTKAFQQNIIRPPWTTGIAVNTSYRSKEEIKALTSILFVASQVPSRISEEMQLLRLRTWVQEAKDLLGDNAIGKWLHDPLLPFLGEDSVIISGTYAAD